MRESIYQYATDEVNTSGNIINRIYLFKWQEINNQALTYSVSCSPISVNERPLEDNKSENPTY